MANGKMFNRLLIELECTYIKTPFAVCFATNSLAVFRYKCIFLVLIGSYNSAKALISILETSSKASLKHLSIVVLGISVKRNNVVIVQ